MIFSHNLCSTYFKDLDNIWEYTVEEWSNEQANKYYNEIFSAIGKICENSDIAGTIKGNLDVSGILSLKSSARIEGEVVAGKLAVESGANVDASISMKGAKKMKALSSTEKPHSEKTA